jgi:hypothetical protein
MKHVIVYGSILAATVAAVATLVVSNSASTQTLPPPSAMRSLETTYTPVGVSAMGGAGSIAWFLETNADKERRPVACVAVSGSVECKRGTFPRP